ncbi:MAG: TIGR01777 family protein [Chitinophagaceae bacterium]|nr:TIGR01777 family protein [Chitinophagaceae bacterium]
MATILLTGGTGLVGRALSSALLEKKHNVIILTRSTKQMAISPQPKNGIQWVQWNVEAQTIDKDAVAKADYIIHLAGAGVADKRWTKKRKQEIVDSRVKSGALLVTALSEIENNVKAVITASAIGWYGADPVIPNPIPFLEDAPADTAFLGDTCRQWEQSIEPVTQLKKRVVKLRIGIVLSKDGGALKEFIKPLQFGVAAILGNGKQMISWIHIDDLVNMFMAAIENENMNGVYNAVAPKPVSNKELTLELARSRKKFFIPFYVPSFILKLLLGEMSIEILKSATVSSTKIQQAGFNFKFPDIKSALKNN